MDMPLEYKHAYEVLLHTFQQNVREIRDLLVHVCSCTDGEKCHKKNCSNLRQMLRHSDDCVHKFDGKCLSYLMSVTVYFVHAKYCKQRSNCIVPRCPYVRHRYMVMERATKRQRIIEQLRATAAKMIESMPEVMNRDESNDTESEADENGENDNDIELGESADENDHESDSDANSEDSEYEDESEIENSNYEHDSQNEDNGDSEDSKSASSNEFQNSRKNEDYKEINDSSEKLDGRMMEDISEQEGGYDDCSEYEGGSELEDNNEQPDNGFEMEGGSELEDSNEQPDDGFEMEGGRESEYRFENEDGGEIGNCRNNEKLIVCPKCGRCFKIKDDDYEDVNPSLRTVNIECGAWP